MVGIDNFERRRALFIPAPDRHAFAARRHEGRVDDAIKPLAHQPLAQDVRFGCVAVIEQNSPLARMDVWANVPFRHYGGLGQVSELRAGQL